MFSIISSSNPDSEVLLVDGGESSRLSEPTSKSVTVSFMAESEGATDDKNIHCSACNDELSLGDLSRSSSSMMKKRISKKNGRSDIWIHF